MSIEAICKVLSASFPSATHKLVAIHLASNGGCSYPPDVDRIARVANSTGEESLQCLRDFVESKFLDIRPCRRGATRLVINTDILSLLADGNGWFEFDALQRLCFERGSGRADELSQAGELTAPDCVERSSAYTKAVIPEQLRWAVFKRDGFACRHCGAQEMLRADHIYPESKGGPTTIENLQTLCRSCNSRKGVKV